MPFKKHFTIEEANRLIPYLLENVPRLQALMAALRSSWPDVKNAQAKTAVNGGSVYGAEYLRFALACNELTNGLKAKGCVLKGADTGLIDFPAYIDGKEVFLCWQLPEQAITHWHDLDEGFAGRRKL